MPSSTPHQKFSFYHLPTRGWAGIKLGDAWYVSNASIIYYCSMLLYIFCFGCLMGFIMHFYIIFGTNLLTEGKVQIDVFCLFRCFKETEYQTESKRNKISGNVIFSPNVIQETWTLLQGTKEAVMRVGGAPPLGRAPLPHGLLVDCLTSTLSPLDHVCSKNHAPEGFIPFGLRLIFFFCETLR